jgi:hydroxymethylglutaryl-CoA lyase
MTNSDIDVLVSEVGTRDGLQNTKAFMSTDCKKRWISAAAAAGLREIEVCSFVPPKLIPQMVDAPEVVAHALTIPGLNVAALAPNFAGAQRAIHAGVHKLTLTISVSKAHSLSNVRMTPDEAIASAKKICDFRDNLPKAQRPIIESGLSTVFGCTLEGAVSEDEVVRMAVASVEAGCDEVGLADTTGYANPEQVRRVFKKVRAAIGHKLSGAHLHNTRGLGLANVVAALAVGVTTFDSSLGGLGGCPFAPGATGNIVTEDLVFMLEAMGLRTGINIDKLLAIRKIVAEGLPGEPLYGYVPDAGVTKGFVPATAFR